MSHHPMEIELQRRAVWRALFLAVALLAVPCLASAQVLYGSLTGNVTDPTGAAIPGARVEALNVSTGAAKMTTTDDDGIYRFSDLQAGVYKVTITAASFKPQAQENVRIEVNTVRRIDVQLQVGEVTGAVEISSATVEALQTDRADVNITQSARQINNLPLFGSVGRNYQTLIQLIPAARAARASSATAAARRTPPPATRSGLSPTTSTACRGCKTTRGLTVRASFISGCRPTLFTCHRRRLSRR